MTLNYQPDPRARVAVPATVTDGWADAAADELASAQGADDPQVAEGLAELLRAAASDERGDEDARWVCAANARTGGIVLDVDILDLGDDAPDDVALDDDAASGQLEEFTAGRARGKRIVWVTPAQAGQGGDGESLKGQVLYVARIAETGFLVTMRSGQHNLDLIIENVPACEEMLATMTADPSTGE